MFTLALLTLLLFFSFIHWCGSLSLENKKRLQGIVRACSKIAGINLNNLTDLYMVRSLRQACTILAKPSHCLAGEFLLLPSGHRDIQSRCRTSRLKYSFVPAAIGFLNDKMVKQHKFVFTVFAVLFFVVDHMLCFLWYC